MLRKGRANFLSQGRLHLRLASCMDGDSIKSARRQHGEMHTRIRGGGLEFSDRTNHLAACLLMSSHTLFSFSFSPPPLKPTVFYVPTGYVVHSGTYIRTRTCMWPGRRRTSTPPLLGHWVSPRICVCRPGMKITSRSVLRGAK